MTIMYSTGAVAKLFGENGVDAGANGLRGIFKNGVIRVYSGAQPINADAAPTGTLLGSITKDGAVFTPGTATNGLNFGAPVGRVVSKSDTEIWQFKGAAAGTIGWVRFQANAVDNDLTSTTLSRIDMSVGITSGDIRFSTVTSTVGAPTNIDFFSLSYPA